MAETIEAMRARAHARDLVVWGLYGAVQGLIEAEGYRTGEQLFASLKADMEARKARLAALGAPAETAEAA